MSEKLTTSIKKTEDPVNERLLDHDVEKAGPRKTTNKQSERKKHPINGIAWDYLIYFCIFQSLFLVHIVIAGILAACSDILTQGLIEERPEWDSERTKRFFCTVFFVTAPLQYVWLKILNEIKGKSTFETGLKRMLLDQLFGAPNFIALYFIMLGYLDGLSLYLAMCNARIIFYTVLFNNYKVWPLFQLFNFSLVPEELRFVFREVVAFFWHMYISYMAA